MIKRGIGLVEGSYQLRQNQFSNKQVYHVKLTETSTKVLDNLIASGNYKYSKAKISRVNNQNILKIPTAGGGYQTFCFQVTPYKQDVKPDIIFQHRKELSKYGTANMKLTVKATNDSFKKIEHSIKQINDKNQESSTQLLDNRKKIGGKYNKKYAKSGKATSILNKPKRDPYSTQNRPSFVQNIQNNNISSLGTDSKLQDPSTSFAGSGRKKTAPSLVGFQKPGKKIPSPTVNLPHKTIVIHLLAVKSYKLDDLVNKLNRLQPKSNFNKQQVLSILQQVAEPVTPSNPQMPADFSLLPRFYKDVSPNWPGYNEKDRHSVMHKKKTEEMRKEIEKKSPQLQQVHTSKPSKFKEEDFTNTIKPKPRVARQKLAKSPESCFSDTEASPAGSNQCENVGISMGLVSDDIIARPPSKPVMQQKAPQKQIRTPIPKKTEEAKVETKKSVVVTADYVAKLSVKDFTEIKDAEMYKHYNEVGAVLEKRYRELEVEIGELQMTVYAMADKYSSASKWQTTKARMEYRGRIVHTAGKRNEQVFKEHRKIHTKMTALLRLIKRYDVIRGLEEEGEGIAEEEFLVRRNVPNADSCQYVKNICDQVLTEKIKN